MTVFVANVSVANTFGHWIERTNQLADAMSTKAVTTNSNTAVGNAAISGTFTANVVVGNTVNGNTVSGNTVSALVEVSAPVVRGTSVVANSIIAQNTLITFVDNVSFSANVTVQAPQASGHATTRLYVDTFAALGQVDVRCATTANITLSGLQTIDGIGTATNDRVLVKDQTNAAQNGIYIASTGAWTRSADVLRNNLNVFVSEGTTHAKSVWGITTLNPIVAGTTNLTIKQTAGHRNFIAGNGLFRDGDNVSIVPVSATRLISAPGTLDLANTGVTPGQYTKITVDSYGRATSATNIVAADVPNLDAGKITTGQLTLARGGSNSSISAPVAGGVAFSNATGLSISAAGTSGHFLSSGGTGTPTWVNHAGANGTAHSVFSNTVSGFVPAPTTGDTTRFLRADGTWIAPPSADGSVTSVDVAGGTTGLTPTGGPITTAGVITLGGRLNLSAGGTNTAITAAAGGVAYGTSNGINLTPAGNAGQILVSNGTNIPVWGAVPTHNHDASQITSGTLALDRGGTNSSVTAAAGAIAFSNATGIALTAAGTTGQVLTSAGTGTPTWTAQSNINANSAVQLATSRTIAITGAVTGTATAFNGTANISIPITAMDVSSATTGTLAVARGGTGIGSYTTNNYLRASGATTLEQRTPAQVLSDIGAAAASHNHDAAAITTGTMATARLGSGTANSTTFLRGDQTWAIPSVSWGTVSGTLSNQTDLQNALNAKASTGTSVSFVDITATRGDGTGILFLGGASRYVWWDGSAYVMPGGALWVNGAPVWTSATFDPNTKANLVSPSFTGTAQFQAASFSGTVSLPSASGNVQFLTGTGDGASYTTYNTRMSIWWGLGLSDFSGTVRGFYDARTGTWDVKTGYVVDGASGTTTSVRAGSGDPATPGTYSITTAGSFGGGIRLVDGAVHTGFYVTNDGNLHFATGNSGAMLSRARVNSSGMAVTGGITATGEITAYSSDARLKTNVVAVENALGKLESIGGYTFNWNNELCAEVGFKPTHELEHGVLAQEIESVMPDAVAPAAFDANYKTVKYDRLTVLLIEAVKELSAKVKELEARNGN